MSPSSRTGSALTRSDLVVVAGSAVFLLLAGLTHYLGPATVPAFICAGIAVAGLAALVGRAVEQLGDRLGAGATGVLQGALGNLPELFIGIFALRAGLVQLVQAAIIGSILSNALLMLGIAFIVGGLRNGVQRFEPERARTACALLFVVVGALVIPSVATYAHAPASGHERVLSTAVSVVLLAVFALSLPAALGRGESTAPSALEPPRWPLWLALTILVLSAAAAAFVSDWFVVALTPAMGALHISQAFAGLVVVAIAGNAIENIAGIQLAARNQADYALSIIINSTLQVALVLAPLLVIFSLIVGGLGLTLVFAPLLVVAVTLTVVAVSLIIFDGRSNWLEGVALVGLYAVIAASFWWG